MPPNQGFSLFPSVVLKAPAYIKATKLLLKQISLAYSRLFSITIAVEKTTKYPLSTSRCKYQKSTLSVVSKASAVIRATK